MMAASHMACTPSSRALRSFPAPIAWAVSAVVE